MASGCSHRRLIKGVEEVVGLEGEEGERRKDGRKAVHDL
jgi:DNA-directed RNA polymerase subunit RPC12/RpoP